MKKIFNIMQFVLILICLYLLDMISFNNISLFLMITLLIIFFKYTKNYELNKSITIFSMLFSLMISLGSINTIGNNNYFYFIIKLFGFFFLFNRILYLISKINISIQYDKDKKNKVSKKKFIIISMIIGFLFFLPYFFKFFPGIITPDSHGQILQAYGINNYSNHHPWIHTLMIKLFFSIGFLVTKKEIVGIALYTLYQMIVLCFIYSYTLYFLYKNNIKKWILLALWMFFFLNPFNAIYSVTIWKDILFSGMVLLFTTFIFDKVNKKWNIKESLSFILLSVLICLLRSNGFIAYLIFIIVMLILHKDFFKSILKNICISLLIVLIIKIPIMRAFHVTKPDFAESISIPLQQMAYVIKQDGYITKSNRIELNKIFDVDSIKKQSNVMGTYVVSDSSKNNVRKNGLAYVTNNKKSFFKTWLKLGLDNKSYYIKAWVLQTSGYWYHNYGENWVYANFTLRKTSEGDLNFNGHNYLPIKISTFYDKYLSFSKKVYHKVWSPAMSLYIVLLSLYLAIERKRNTVAWILTIGIFLTLLIATPVSCEFRYFYSFFLCFPIFVVYSLMKEKE